MSADNAAGDATGQDATGQAATAALGETAGTNETRVTPEDDDAAIALAHTLFDAARSGDGVLLGRYLDAGVPVGLTTASGDSLLMLAAYGGHPVVVTDLLGRGADVHQVNDRGQTPLAGAVFKGHTDVVRLLLAGGADPDAGTPSARATAEMFARTEAAAMFGRWPGGI